jgi:hypothetical protein
VIELVSLQLELVQQELAQLELALRLVLQQLAQ